MNSRNTRLVTVFLFALVLFNFPVVGIIFRFNRQSIIPVGWVYIFAVWLIIIMWVRKVAK